MNGVPKIVECRSQKNFQSILSELLHLFLGRHTRSYFKNADPVQGEGAGPRRKVPLTALARLKQTDLNRSAIISTALPERHDAFAWAGLPGRSLARSPVAQAKKIYCLRNVCVCLRFNYIIVNRKQRGSTDHSFNSFGDDPKFKMLS